MDGVYYLYDAALWLRALRRAHMSGRQNRGYFREVSSFQGQCEQEAVAAEVDAARVEALGGACGPLILYRSR